MVNALVELNHYLEETNRWTKEKPGTLETVSRIEQFLEREEAMYQIISDIELLAKGYIGGEEYFFGYLSMELSS